MTEAAKGGQNGGEGELHEDGAEGAAEDDEGGSGLQNLTEISAVDEQARNDAGDGQEDSGNTRFVHRQLLQAPDAEIPIQWFNGWVQ
jgi:hypothetical protein